MVTREKAIAVGIDYDQGLERFVGKADLYERFLAQFPEEKNFAKIKEAMEEGDIEVAFKHAHALKGVVGNLSMNFFFESVAALVEELRNERLDNAKMLLPTIEEQYQQLIHALQ